MKRLIGVALLLILTGCQDMPLETEAADTFIVSPTNDDLRLVRGYRSTDDDCQLTGETAFTVDFLDDAADLVSCPSGSDAAQSLVDMYSARQVAKTGGYTVYSVPRR
ncbi:hypothetical protein RUE5091_02620 [Ruegeria denitrificans]|uniref:Uncharacterized protein n=1 Tax=Ruegeria denitrificans TaxID=1715692 RepID=A0A0P1IIP1_9RHOB|nr:hypothetical protein [Ruegeria denitrificans]CUK04389.1 hypothetical protein RUE5091_02620 [Ruegeria denitrificans]